MQTQTYVYDDQDPAQPPRRPPGTPARVVKVIQSPAFTLEDQVLLRGLELYEQTLCECGEKKTVAWHTEMDGYYDDTHSVKCFACSALAGRDVIYRLGGSSRPADKPMPPFVLGVTTTSS
ncbi:hypothetical protein GON03_19015 [Nocardioides sp. MAH-18]|uniref:Uncharacterized protein n=1 Tax=Nocardioides agri TaxID=2682843 RepID=A0A6L6XX51_9ACTN|nr:MULTISPECIES: hypothetical protein [unclassified Nocardioides]MBA2952108.1 hypothetical protein [Nocardioides sp. CGMCC 1.13656]MVQ51277.1 hypothetical protein [Nocardioides sp. MAH-18]